MNSARTRIWTRLALAPLLACAMLAAGAATASAHPGLLDLTFDGDGYVVTEPRFGGSEIAPEGNGDIVLATWSRPSGGLPVGGIGHLFRIPGSGGTPSPFASFPDGSFSDVLVQPDGRIVVAGQLSSGDGEMLVARFHPGGALDTGFAGDGTYTSNDADEAVSIELAPDGRLVVAGNEVGGPSGVVVKRLDANGSEDASFSDVGSGNFVDAIAVQSDGKPVSAGRTAGDDWLVLRLTTGFASDPGFAPPSLDFGTQFDHARDVLVQPDGRIVVGGQSRPDNGSAPVVRLLANGSLDPSFGGSGIVQLAAETAATGLPGAAIHELALDGEGRVLAGGYGDLALLLRRLNPDGTIDPGFHIENEQTGALASLGDLIPLADGKILAGFNGVGRAEPPPQPGETTNPVGVARFLGADVRCGGKQATIVASEGDDASIAGTSDGDVIAALGGADRVRGLGGKDRICGGKGRDRLAGGRGKDRILGGRGRDRLKGGAGRDLLRGGKGRDVLSGGKGRDRERQ